MDVVSMVHDSMADADSVAKQARSFPTGSSDNTIHWSPFCFLLTSESSAF